MAIQYSTALRNEQLNTIETVISTAPKMRFYSGSAPADCAAAASGTMLLEITLPSDWLQGASSGTKAKNGTWTGTGDAGAGAGTTAGYFRIYDASVTTCHAQGTVTAVGGGGDVTFDNTSIASGQVVTVNTFTFTAANA